MGLQGFLLHLIQSLFFFFFWETKTYLSDCFLLVHVNVTPPSLLLPVLVALYFQEETSDLTVFSLVMCTLHPITGYIFSLSIHVSHRS